MNGFFSQILGALEFPDVKDSEMFLIYNNQNKNTHILGAKRAKRRIRGLGNKIGAGDQRTPACRAYFSYFSSYCPNCKIQFFTYRNNVLM